jgi:hypothetical protein
MNWRMVVYIYSFVFNAHLVSETALAATISTPKSFAVFVTFYNTHDDNVRGGVCGTVFFVSPTQAITAHHVLKAESFKPLPGFDRVKVWLVHEGYRPVEMRPEYIQSNPSTDVTTIQIPTARAVDRSFVYATGGIEGAKQVETDGFVANTAGPQLTRVGADVVVTAVDHLERLHLSGTVIRTAQVNLKATDLELKGSPEVEFSYQPVVGISGGPVTSNGKVIAMNSFADPATFKHTWGLQLRASTSGLTP